MLRRVNPKGGDTFFVDAECHPQTIAVVRTRAEPLGIDVVVGEPEPRSAGTEGVFGVLLQYPGTTGAHPRRPRAGRATCTRRARWSRSPPTSSRWCCSPRRGSGAPTSSSGRAALRRAHGLRRPARRRSSPRARSTSATCPAGSVGVSVDAAGRPRAAPRAADARAAHPPREGHEQHLHRAGAAGQHRRHVRRVPRPRRPARHRRARAPAHAPSSRPTLPRAACDETFFDTDRGARRRRRRGARARARRRASTSAASTTTTVGIALDETTTAATVVDARRARCSTRRPTDRDGRSASRRRCAGRPTSSCTRCSAPTTPSRRCCATCASSPTATSRSTAR